MRCFDCAVLRIIIFMKYQTHKVTIALWCFLIIIFMLSLNLHAPILIVSIAVRLLAAIIAAVLIFQHREWRIIFLVVMFLLMASRQILTFLLWAGYIQNSSITKSMSEIPGFIVTILSLVSIIYIGVILNRKNKIIKKQDNNLKALYGLLPICSKCKKIRNDNGSWIPVEAYIVDHSDAKFSHGLCKECEVTLYGAEDWYKN